MMRIRTLIIRMNRMATAISISPNGSDPVELLAGVLFEPEKISKKRIPPAKRITRTDKASKVRYFRLINITVLAARITSTSYFNLSKNHLLDERTCDFLLTGNIS